MFCPNCGSKLPEDSRFCSECGASMDAGQPVQQTQPKQKAPKKLSWWKALLVVMAMSLIGTLVGEFIVAPSYSGSNSSTKSTTQVQQEQTFTLHVYSPDTWYHTCIWAWSDDGTDLFEAWPGEMMDHEGDGWYSYELPNWVDNVVINGNNGTVQTGDISLAGLEEWIVVYDDFSIETSFTKIQDPGASLELPVRETFDNDWELETAYLSGGWGEKFIRSNGYSYPFELDMPLYSCRGFTLDYMIEDVSKGNLSGTFKYEIYVRTLDGSWKSVELFQMEGYEKTVEVVFDDPMSIEAVAVVCQKQAEVNYTYAFGIRNPVY